MAFYLGKPFHSGDSFPSYGYLGFLTWVFPTTYIAQKSRVAKYLGRSSFLALKFTNWLDEQGLT